MVEIGAVLNKNILNYDSGCFFYATEMNINCKGMGDM